MSINTQKEALLAMLKDESTEVRTAASLSLGALEASGRVAELAREIQEGSPQSRIEAIYALRNVVTEDGLKLLGQLTTHAEADVRCAALRVILEKRDPRLIKAVSDCLKDSSDAAASLAAEYLAEIGDRRAESILVQSLREAPDGAKGAILVTLAKLRSAQAVPLALKAMRSPHQSIRLGAARALGLMVQTDS